MNIYDLHSETWNGLLARRERLPHALLLSGRRGIGKFDLATAFAHALLCETPGSERVACGACPACNWLAQGNHPDFRLLQPEALNADEGEAGEGGAKKKPSQQITIDQVRALDSFLHVGTHRQGVRVVLVHPAEAMNRSTANSLLKSLEEPLPSTLFILVSGEPDRLLPTIRSRCQTVPVPVPEAPRAARWLAQSGVPDAERWLALAGGAPLLAAELGAGDERDLLDALITELARGGRIDALAAAAALDRVVKAEKRATPLKRAIEWAQKWLSDLALAQAGQAPRYFVGEAQRLQDLVRGLEATALLAFGRKTIQYRLQCEQPLNSRLFFEDFFMNYAALFGAPRDRHG